MYDHFVIILLFQTLKVGVGEYLRRCIDFESIKDVLKQFCEMGHISVVYRSVRIIFVCLHGTE